MRHEISYAENRSPMPRVVVIGLASCFGCQIQITNDEPHLLDILSQLDLRYWQLTSSDPMPEEFDVAIIEGAVTSTQAQEMLKKVREKAGKIITIGACAFTSGVCGIASKNFDERPAQVYDNTPSICGNVISPRSVLDEIEVDYVVPGCPIDPAEFKDVLGRALYGSNRSVETQTMCGECKKNGSSCFYAEGKLCLGLVTRSGCGARCVNLGRPCNGCRGISSQANLESAREALVRYGVSLDAFNASLELFNQNNPALHERGK